MAHFTSLVLAKLERLEVSASLSISKFGIIVPVGEQEEERESLTSQTSSANHFPSHGGAMSNKKKQTTGIIKKGNKHFY